ncbi:uncharacterized protein LOC111265738 isoform X2 [Varroa jacobsoni]|uniref:NADH dehydrogenase [ubiquinone] flavoprotein 3, mitochondrial n=1 Tax=Varroa destructor TaxID=109461 RepID=A0A7M7K8P6_VARDE|nr:uncharacterized protein LOC111249640 isoform X2 [Varroa destructor]XP_022698373.1 uncharacterized protein LOC111265738 isoform X2 [Varroa jacobsoni]
MGSRRLIAIILAKRQLSDQPPKKIKNFAEISQTTNQTVASPRAASKASERSSSITAAAGLNKAAGEEYLVPEYSKHNEYSFYDLNLDLTKERMPQPQANRLD